MGNVEFNILENENKGKKHYSSFGKKFPLYLNSSKNNESSEENEFLDNSFIKNINKPPRGYHLKDGKNNKTYSIDKIYKGKKVFDFTTIFKLNKKKIKRNNYHRP